MEATRRHLTGMSGVFCAFVASASCSHAVKPDSMSAEQHRQEADKEMTRAQTEIARANRDAPPPPNLTVSNGNPAGYYYPVDAYNPAGEHLLRARALEEHARQHRDAATKLEAFAQDECGGFPPETRPACPMLGPVSQIADAPMGVKVWFTPNTRVDAVAAHMRCHLAYAKVYGFDTVQACPLYVRGLQINVSADGKAIELTSHEPRTVDVIRARTREEAVLVRR